LAPFLSICYRWEYHVSDCLPVHVMSQGNKMGTHVHVSAKINTV
jgi:hypothetical protein